MKKFSILLLLLLVSCTKQQQTTSMQTTQTSIVQEVSVASYNMLRLGHNNGKDYKTLASVINNFDLVGAIEVMNQKGMDLTVAELGSNWSYIISERSVGSSSYKEFFGFFYNDRIELIKTLGFYVGDARFERPPYGARFKVKDSDFEFNLIIAHTVFGDSVAERIAETNNFGLVYAYFESLTGNQHSTIIAGDFNLETIAEFNELIDMGVSEIATVGKSTIGVNGPVSDYDHMFISEQLREKIIESNVLYWTSDWITTKKTVSDHFPVYVKFKL